MKTLSATRSTTDEGYLASVSDLLVGLLFLFIILLMAFALNFRVAEEAARSEHARLVEELGITAEARQRLAAERDRLLAEQRTLAELLGRLTAREAERLAMLQSVASLLAEREVQVVLSPEEGVLRLPEELLFDSGSAVLRSEGERALRELATVLARLLPCYANAPPISQADCPRGARPILEAVLVEGHSDDVPIAAGPFRDNWELSAARGVNTFKALVRYQPSLELLTNARGEPLLGVSAYEARRPVIRDTSPEARWRNRRIDLRFLLAAPSPAELEDIRSQLRR